MVAPTGTGSLRQRRPGVWEIRVAAGTDPVTGRTLQRSIAFRGTADEAEHYRRELAAEYAERRGAARAAPLITVGDLLERWLAADHPWRPSTAVSYRSNVRALTADVTLAGARVMSLTPRLVRAAFVRWEAARASQSVIGGRFRVLRSAVGWAYDERVSDDHPSAACGAPVVSSPGGPWLTVRSGPCCQRPSPTSLARWRPATAAGVAANAVSVQAVSKQIRVLADAGLVSQSKDAQRRPCHLEAEVFDLMTKWIERYRHQAQERYERLDAVLAEMRGDERPIDHHLEEGAAS